MRCPKCQYLSFDNGERCRNCGYEFSLAVNAAPLDLAIQDGTEAIGPMADLALRDAGRTDAVPASFNGQGAVPAPDTGSLEQPLFTPAVRSQPPLVTPSNPRAPLSVRRQAPAPPKSKHGQPQKLPRKMADEPRLALDTAEFPSVLDEEESPDRAIERSGLADPTPAPLDSAGVTAPAAGRVLAAVVDLAIVGGIDAAVFYLTLRVLEIHVADARAIPIVPFIAFLLLLNGSYFAAFVAASGQTIGKMAAGIRVVPGDPIAQASDRVPLGAAVIRAAAYIVSALPAGLGFLPGVMGKDHRALHDRLADTRVVKA